MKEGSRGLREKQDTVYTQKEIGRPRDSLISTGNGLQPLLLSCTRKITFCAHTGEA